MRELSDRRDTITFIWKKWRNLSEVWQHLKHDKQTGKNREDFFFFLHCFSTDQSEAELLYFYSLFFSLKKPFQKTKVVVSPWPKLSRKKVWLLATRFSSSLLLSPVVLVPGLEDVDRVEDEPLCVVHVLVAEATAK
jgi:hypothetical protein